jgi:hypothetical protein
MVATENGRFCGTQTQICLMQSKTQMQIEQHNFEIHKNRGGFVRKSRFSVDYTGAFTRKLPLISTNFSGSNCISSG